LGDLCEQRYVKFSLKPQEIADLLVAVSLEQRRDAPKQIILDLDVTNDPVHGSQAQAFFNAYYDQTCYAPLLIFWGHQLLCARLRPSNVDPAAGALEELQRIIAQIRKRWSEVVIIVRGDSAYGREDIMAWCEAQTNVEYVLAHASNPRLSTFTWGLEQRAKAALEQHRQQIANNLEPLIGNAKALQTELDAVVPPQVYYQSLTYQRLF
jgi:hypothetical protein